MDKEKTYRLQIGRQLMAQVKYWSELNEMTINEWVKQAIRVYIEESKAYARKDTSGKINNGKGGINYD